MLTYDELIPYPYFYLHSGRGDGGAGGALAPHFLLRRNLCICILLFFVSMYLYIFVHNLRYKGLFLGVSKALWDAQFYLSSKHSVADLQFYRISGPPTQILEPRPLLHKRVSTIFAMKTIAKNHRKLDHDIEVTVKACLDFIVSALLFMADFGELKQRKIEV